MNPLTGEKAMLVESDEETEGARIVSEFAVEVGGFVAIFRSGLIDRRGAL